MKFCDSCVDLCEFRLQVLSDLANLSTHCGVKGPRILGATLLLIGFDGLLRPGELALLRRADVRLPSDAQGLPTSVVVVTIRLPKNAASRNSGV